MIGLRLAYCETVKKIPDNTNIEALNSNFLPPSSYVHTRSTVVVVMLVRFDIFKTKHIFDQRSQPSRT